MGLQSIHTDYESALSRGSTVVAQEGTTIGTLAGVDVYDSFTALSGNTFSSNFDGGSCRGGRPARCGDSDGTVGIVDFLAVLDNWGACP